MTLTPFSCVSSSSLTSRFDVWGSLKQRRFGLCVTDRQLKRCLVRFFFGASRAASAAAAAPVAASSGADV